MLKILKIPMRIYIFVIYRMENNIEHIYFKTVALRLFFTIRQIAFSYIIFANVYHCTTKKKLAEILKILQKINNHKICYTSNFFKLHNTKM